MSHVAVARLTLALAALLAAAALAFAWRQAHGAGPRPKEAPGGDAQAIVSAPPLFERHCAACHTLEDLAAELRAAPDPALAVLARLAFLEDHGASDDREDRALVALVLEHARAGR